VPAKVIIHPSERLRFVILYPPLASPRFIAVSVTVRPMFHKMIGPKNGRSHAISLSEIFWLEKSQFIALQIGARGNETS
jgi:hypothetical protein